MIRCRNRFGVGMIIYLGQLKEDVEVAVHEEYDPQKLDMEFVDLKYISKLVMEGQLEKGHDALKFSGQLFTDVENTCGRCLKKVTSHVEQPFQLYYETKGLEQVDTTDDLREILMLNHSLNYVCQEACRGLCPHCGINLNETQCDCEKKFNNSALSRLQDIWEKMKEEKKHGSS